MEQDGLGTYEHLCRQVWKFIYKVALKDSTGFLRGAWKTIPQAAPYIRATVGNENYYETLVRAPMYLRALVYLAQVNDKGHFFGGAHLAFPVEASLKASELLDKNLQVVLGDSAPSYPLFSANRELEELRNPIDIEAGRRRRNCGA